MEDILIVALSSVAWCGSVQGGHKSTCIEKGTENQECPQVFTTCQGTRSTVSSFNLDNANLIALILILLLLSGLSRQPQSRSFYHLCHGWCSCGKRKGLGKWEPNQWLDQKVKITHLYIKRLLYILCWGDKEWFCGLKLAGLRSLLLTHGGLSKMTWGNTPAPEPILWNRCKESWPGFKPLCGWEKAWKLCSRNYNILVCRWT